MSASAGAPLILDLLLIKLVVFIKRNANPNFNARQCTYKCS
jgi:hypothetical protein